MCSCVAVTSICTSQNTSATLHLRPWPTSTSTTSMRIAEQFDTEVKVQPWGREIELTDPFGNRLRIGTVRSTV